MIARVAAIVGKELADLRQNPGVFVSAAITGVLSLLLPFFVAVIVPTATGERLADSGDIELAYAMRRAEPAAAALSDEAAIQGWIFQQFLLMLILTPIAGAMSVAAYSVVGEKQARTLEPLLATPITTAELLAAKILGAALPAAALTVVTFTVYVAGIAVFAEPGAWRLLLLPRPLAVMFLLGPLASLLAIELAVCVSSRARDPRSAQQIAALILLPITGLLVAQLIGELQLTLAAIAVIAAVLAVLDAALLLLAVSLFSRESILTRWE